MSSPDSGTGTCKEQVTLTTNELRMLDALNGIHGFGITAQLSCDLEPGHAGDHLTLGQSTFDPATEQEEQWWLAWDGTRRFLTETPYCPATLGFDVDDGICNLPTGHVGRHTYEWRPESLVLHRRDRRIELRVIEPSTASPRPPVLFLSDLGTTLDAWSSVLDHLKTQAPRLIVYNRAGTGSSTPRPGDQPAATIGDLADEAAYLLDELAITEPVILVSHAVGSLIAHTFVARWPDRVAGLVHIDGTRPDHRFPKGTYTLDGQGPDATQLSVDNTDWDNHEPVTTAATRPTAILRSARKLRHMSPTAGACIDALDLRDIPAEAPNLVALAIRAVADATNTPGPNLALDVAAVATAGGRVIDPT